MTEAFRIYPCTIIASRYCGTYEGGAWLAFNCDENSIPEGATGGDIECSVFWDNVNKGLLAYQKLSYQQQPKTIIVGKGETPNEAVTDLLRQLKAQNE